MNSRAVILGVAALAACLAVFLVRGLLGGGTEKAKASLPPRPATTEVLVAARDLQPGTPLVADAVRWQSWPKSSVDPSFISRDQTVDLDSIVKGAVVRAPLVDGEPLTAAKVVHAEGAGFMAATVEPGTRAVSIGISTESGAGGFILPNDRVDILLTEQSSDMHKRFATRTILTDVRVLAVDQTYREDKDQKVVLAKTATLELAPRQAEQVERAQAMGTLSLSLRALGDEASASPGKRITDASANLPDVHGKMTVIGYGVSHMIDDEQGD